MAMLDPYGYCESLLREGDKDRFLSTLFAPEDKRPALFVMHAFDLELERIVALVREPLAGEVRFQWWHEIITGQSTDGMAGNPLAMALTETIARFNLSQCGLIDMIEAHRCDLYPDSNKSLDDLDRYAEKTSGMLFECMARILHDEVDSGIGKIIRHAAIAFTVTRLLSALPFHAARGRLYVPTDIFARHGASAADLFAGKVTADVRAALSDLRAHIRHHLAEISRLVTTIPQGVESVFLPLALLPPVLDRMDRRRYDPLKPISIPQWRRQLILWRAARDISRAL